MVAAAQERRLRAPLQAPSGPPGGASSSEASAPVSGRGWSKRAIRRYRPRFGSPGALRAGAGVFAPAFLVTGRRTGAAIAAAESGSARPVAQSPAATKNWSYMATTAAPPRPSSRPSPTPVICGMTECALRILRGGLATRPDTRRWWRMIQFPQSRARLLKERTASTRRCRIRGCVEGWYRILGALAAQLHHPTRRSKSPIPAERLTLCLPDLSGLDSVREGASAHRFGACRVASESIRPALNLAG